MNKLVSAGATMAIAMMLLPAAGFAKSGGSFENVPYAVKARCDTLKQRFDDASSHPKEGVDLAAAKSAASQGGSLCRSGQYEEGGATLEKALKMIGAPAN